MSLSSEQPGPLHAVVPAAPYWEHLTVRPITPSSDLIESKCDDAVIPCDPHAVMFCHGVTEMAAVLVAAIGLVSLASWVNTLPPVHAAMRQWVGEIREIRPIAGVTMKANISVCLICAALALAILHRPNRHRLLIWIGHLLALLVLGVGIATLVEHLSGRNLEIDQVLFAEPAGAAATASPNRPGPPAAIALSLAGLALLTLNLRTRRGWAPAQLLAIFIAVIALFSLIGYAYQLAPLYRLPRLTGIALHTSLALFFLAIGLLCARPDRGMMAIICAADAGGMMARRLFLPAVLLPLLVGWLQIQAQRSGFDAYTGEAIEAVALVVVFVILVGSATVAVGRASRKRLVAEETLRTRAAELEALFAAVPLPLWVAHERECTKFTANAAAQSLLRIPSGEPDANANGAASAGNPRIMRSGAEVLHAQMPLYRAAQEGRAILNEEYQLVTEDGFCSDVVFSAVPFRDQSGNVSGCLAVAMDITALKQAEVAAQQAREAAESASRVKDQFMAMLSHELRTPLTPVVTLVQMLLQDATLPADLRETMQTMRRNLELEVRLIDDLLDLTRISRGKLALRIQSVDLHEMIRHAAADCNAEIRGNGLTLDLRLDARQWMVEADESRVQQVLLNLLRNSIKFTPAGGRITVSSHSEGRFVAFRVQDTGIGIDPTSLGRIFGAFEQAAGSVMRGGLGLGLAVSRSIIHAHGGTIAASSAGRDRGSTFTVSLPLSPVQSKPKAAPDARVPGSRAAELANLRILLVEDHNDTARAMSRLLSKMGHQVRTADTVAAALRAADAEAFDLLLCDVGLPDGTGLDLMRQLLNRAGKPVRGIALSGFGMESDIRSSREAGFAAHLVKPVNLTELASTIQRVAQS